MYWLQWLRHSICILITKLHLQHKVQQLSVLDEPTLPDPFQEITNSDIEEAGDENTMVLDEDSDVDIEL